MNGQDINKKPAQKRQVEMVDNPLRVIAQMVDAANLERNKLMQICMTLVRKLGNDVVVTFGELEETTPNLMLRRHSETDLGFRLTVEPMPPSGGQQ